MKKKLLLLGGSAQQVTAIETAKRLGYETVICDYLEDNPGQYAADRFYRVSTTDREAVLNVARQEQVDGVLAYASDPAAPAAAYAAEHLGLPGNPYTSVEILCNKDKYRAFLKEHGFCTPEAEGYSGAEQALEDIRKNRFHFPVLIKPVDSSGSKGVSRIDEAAGAEAGIAQALSFSRAKRFIVEEYVEKSGYQIAGDGFSVDGELVFRCFANDHFEEGGVNPFVPVAATFPCVMPDPIQKKVHDEIQRLITLLGMGTCAYNFDIRVDRDCNVYLMEMAPRSGGNYIPQIIRHATGVDLVECAVKAAMGEAVSRELLLDRCRQKGYWAYYAVHSRRKGILEKVEVSPEVRKRHLVEDHLIKKSGDPVEAFSGANTTLGILLMQFDGLEQMLDMVEKPEQWIRVTLK